jgi:polysaccharide biosynthesis transport protein
VILRDYLVVLRSRWTIVVLCVLLAGGLGAYRSLRAAPSYAAQASVVFSVGLGRTSGDLSRGFSYAEGLASSYAQVATQPVVLAPVITSLGLQTTPAALAHRVRAEVPLDTVIVDITVADPSAPRAATIANAIASQLLSTVNAQNARGARSAPAVRMTIASQAATATTSDRPSLALALTEYSLIGLVLGILLAFVRDLFDTRVRRPQDVAQLTEVPVIGAVPTLTHSRLEAVLRRRNRDVEAAARVLRLNFLQLRAEQSLRSVTFTSATDGAQAALTVRSLGQQLANVGVRTLLVDADIVRPALSESFGCAGDPGLSTVLRGEATWRDVVRERHPALHVLPAGPAWAGASLAVQPDAVEALLRELSAEYDVVLAKAPPVLRAADGLMLARIADGVVVVADSPVMRRSELDDEVQALGVANVRPTGIVLVA